MTAIIRTTVCVTACVLLALLGCVQSQAEQTHKPTSLTAINYVTGWQLDEAGYHPAVFMLLENTSGKDLTAVQIRLQGRFTDLQTAAVTIGRAEVRRDLKPHQQFSLTIASAQPFELPYQVEMWPRLEVKVMCRVGDVGDEGTETLLITRIDEIARSQDEAFEHLNEAASYARLPSPATSTATPVPPSAMPHEQPPAAAAARIDDMHIKHASRLSAVESPHGTATSFLSEKGLPGLGDDFYKFEQRFGLPTDVDAKHSDWTWACYEDKRSQTELIAGSHDRRGDVDVLIVTVPKTGAGADADADADKIDLAAASGAARELAGKLRAQALSAASKSVRYLPSGRVEVVTRNAPAYHVLCMSPPQASDNSLILILSRAPQDVEQLLATQVHKTKLLRSVQFLGQP